MIAVHRILEAEAVIESDDIESLEDACRRSQWAVERICLSIKKIHIVMILAQALQKIHFLRLMVAREKLFTLIQAQHLLAERQVTGNDFMHVRLDLFDFIVRRKIHARAAVFHRLKLADLTIEAARKRIIYRQHLVRVHFPDDILKNEAERTDVCTASVRVRITDELHIVRVYDLIVERDELPVHESGQNGHAAAAFRLDRRADALRKSFKGRSHGHIFI